MYISHSHTFTYGWRYFSFKNVFSSMFWNFIIWLISSMWYFSSSMLSTSTIFWLSFKKFNFIHVIGFMNVIHIIWLIYMSSISSSCSLVVTFTLEVQVDPCNLYLISSIWLIHVAIYLIWSMNTILYIYHQVSI